MNSAAAGTTINFILAGLASGAGIIAAEALKEIGKDLWKATKACFREKEKQPERGMDTITIKIDVKGEEFTASLSLDEKLTKAATPIEAEVESFLTERIGDFGNYVNTTLERAIVYFTTAFYKWYS